MSGTRKQLGENRSWLVFLLHLPLQEGGVSTMKGWGCSLSAGSSWFASHSAIALVPPVVLGQHRKWITYPWNEEIVLLKGCFVSLVVSHWPNPVWSFGMADKVWSLVSCCSRKQCGDTGISRVSKGCFQGVLLHSSLHWGVRWGEITYLMRVYLAISRLALTIHKIIKELGAGSNSPIKKGMGVEIWSSKSPYRKTV